jgi:hypothetical protein
MSDDLIVVDDIGDLDVDSLMPPPDTPRTSSSGRPMRRTSAASRLASVAALGGPADAPAQASTERTTRSAAKQRAQPKLKLKLSDKAAAQVAGMSFLGAYDRELDDSDEDLTFDEHFILRLPPGDDCERLRRAVASREVGSDVWFKFKGARVCVMRDSGILTVRQTRDARYSTSATRPIPPSSSTCHASSRLRRLSTTSRCSRSRTYVRSAPHLLYHSALG